MKTFNLSNVISRLLYDEKKGWQKVEIQLSDKQKDQFVALFSKKCRSKTLAVLRKAVNDNFRRLKNYGIFNRVLFEGDEVSYCAGQDCPSEKALIRKLIFKYY